jgi:polygalacturonase
MISRVPLRIVGLAAVIAALLARPAAAGDWQPIAPPEIPDRSFPITDYGAVADSPAPATDALRKCIEAAAKAGGGIVRVPAGRFLTGPFALASRINLHLEKGATLLLINDVATYPKSGKGYADWITADKCQDVAITGEGTIDGQGQPWWDRYRKVNGVAPTDLPHRPHMIRLRSCSRVRVEGVSLLNSPNVHLITDDCEDVTIEGVTIRSPADSPNTDGLNPSGWRYRIARCTIDTGDDNIAIKAHRSARPGQPSCEDMLIEDCTFQHGHGLSIGGQTPGGLRHLLARRCTFDGTQAGIRLKAPRGEGGVVEDCTYEDLTLSNVKVPIYITSYYPSVPRQVESDPAQPVTATTPIWRDIRIARLTAKDCPEAGRIIGLPEMPISSVTLTDVRISAEQGLRVVHAKGVRFAGSQIVSKKGPPLITSDAEVTGLGQ